MEISGVMDYKVQNKGLKKFSKDLENRYLNRTRKTVSRKYYKPLKKEEQQSPRSEGHSDRLNKTS